MDRIRQAQAEVFSAAMEKVPARLHSLLGCDLFCGDPLFAGLWRPEWQLTSTVDGRSYHDTACVAFPYHMRDKRLTMVLHKDDTSVYTVLHELGHVLHWNLFERMGESWKGFPGMVPVSRYAVGSWWESFAEAFVAWFYSPRERDENDYWPWGHVRSNDEFFDRLLLA